MILVEREEPIAVVLLNRPKQLNALSTELMDELAGALKELDADEAVRAIVVGGSERAFAAGADIDELSRATPIDLYYQRRMDRWEEIRALWTPLVAAVSGYCLGGGCELALACDLIVSSETARFGQPETGLGIIPGAGGTQRLSRLVGPAKAKDLIFTGRHVGAEEALEMGLADAVVPDDEVYPTAVAMARKFAAGPPLALAAAKRAIDEGLDGDLATGLALESRLFAELFDTEDQKTGMASFLEQGPGKATFSGR
jgi:enoyl-CoA hydratase/carnithine racemase